jgi:hypothetical protein
MIEIITTEGIAIMFRQLRKTFAALCLFLVAWGTAAWDATCSAATIIGSPVALSTLLVPGGTHTSGDKVFTNFTYMFTGEMPAAVNVNVVSIKDDFGNFGIRFQGNFIDLPSSVGGSDALITYDVTAGAGFLISDAHLQGNPVLLGNVGSISVTETFLPLGPLGQFTMTIFDDENSAAKLVDEVIFTTPVKTLNVQKDIQAIAVAGTQSVVLSFVDQTFSQIPEPTTCLLLMVGGLSGMAFIRNRGRQNR